MADDVASTFGPVPGAILQATADELWLKGNRGDFRIPRTAVVKIGRGSLYPWFFKGIRIRHSLSALPGNLQFLPLKSDTAQLSARLRTLGYPVA